MYNAVDKICFDEVCENASKNENHSFRCLHGKTWFAYFVHVKHKHGFLLLRVKYTCDDFGPLIKQKLTDWPDESNRLVTRVLV